MCALTGVGQRQKRGREAEGEDECADDEVFRSHDLACVHLAFKRPEQSADSVRGAQLETRANSTFLLFVLFFSRGTP